MLIKFIPGISPSLALTLKASGLANFYFFTSKPQPSVVRTMINTRHEFFRKCMNPSCSLSAIQGLNFPYYYFNFSSVYLDSVFLQFCKTDRVGSFSKTRQTKETFELHFRSEPSKSLARNACGRVRSFSNETFYWQIRFEPSQILARNLSTKTSDQVRSLSNAHTKLKQKRRSNRISAVKWRENSIHFSKQFLFSILSMTYPFTLLFYYDLWYFHPHNEPYSANNCF